jgi:3-deoxy-D-manno-octulosonate 8-phosphate phosphatase (KDO 8-P phosphatase)
MCEHLVDDVEERVSKIKLLLMDCDGVLTDGCLYFNENGEAMKVFNVKDGQGIVNWHEKGFMTGIISGRNSKMVQQRANELGIKFVKQGSKDKIKDFEDILRKSGFNPTETAYIGDDIPDIQIMKRVGLSIAVADAAEALFEFAHLKTSKYGGCGAVREMIDTLLQIKLRKL